MKKTTLLSLFIFCIIIAFPVQTNAASAKKKALNGYEKILNSSKIRLYISDSAAYDDYLESKDMSFALAYIDDDSVPEMIIRRTDKMEFWPGYDSIIFTWKNSKVKRLNVKPSGSAYKVTKYYKKTGVFINHSNFGETMYVKLAKGKTSLELSCREGSFKDSGKPEYSNKTRDLSGSEFKLELKKLVKNKKASKLKFYKNTTVNRKKHLK